MVNTGDALVKGQPMADISGIHHISLTVSDLDVSTAWYSALFDVTVARRWAAGDLEKAMLVDSDGKPVLILTTHGAEAVAGPFSECRPGLDHLAFAVADTAALEQWRDRLDSLGIERSDIAEGSTGHLIAFRDPDNIALEFYTLIK